MNRVLFVHPATRSYREPLFRRLGELGVDFLFTTINDPNTHAGKETYGLLASAPYHFVQAREIRGIGVRNVSWDLGLVRQYPVVIYSSLTSAPYLLGQLMHPRCRKILFDENWMYPGDLTHRLIRPWVGHCVRRTSAFVCAGSAAQEMFASEFRVDKERLFVAGQPAVDLLATPGDEALRKTIFGHVREAAGSRKIILFLGRLVGFKAPEIMIEAMEHVAPNACLLIVGEGPLEEPCRRKVQALGLSDRVLFLGPCLAHEARYYMEACDVFVLPSRFLPREKIPNESWGFTVNEAMSLRKPTVATDAVGAARDLIIDGETGMLARQNDPPSLAAKTQALLDDDALRERIGVAGREHLLEVCSLERAVAAFQSAIALAESER